MLAVSILGTGLIGPYTTVPAAEFSAGALVASETLEWLSAVFASAGIAVSVKELLKPKQADIEKDIGKHIDWDNYDWGDILDSPATQGQIDELDETVNRLYDNAVKDWYVKHGGTLPTPTPEPDPTDSPDISPPVTVTPIDPDTVTPPDWETLRKTSMHNGSLFLGAATYWCLKEAVKEFWDDIVNDNYTNNPTNDWNNNALYPDTTYDGYTYFASAYYTTYNGKFSYYRKYYFRTQPIGILFFKTKLGNLTSYMLDSRYNILNQSCTQIVYMNGEFYSSNSTPFGADLAGLPPSYDPSPLSFTCTIPTYMRSDLTASDVDTPQQRKEIIEGTSAIGKSKDMIWVNPNLKNNYDNNQSPSLPDTAPTPAVKIPSLDDLKDLQKKGNDASDDDRPSIILDWLKDHYTNPSTDPQPTTAPNPDPNPTTAPNPDPDPDPDPNPDPTTTPAVNPEPSTAPKPSGTPENPDDTDTDTDIDPDDYKADLRLVFPFCIPFDLVHLIQAFEADPEAPVFEFPVDIELNDPFAGSERSAKKIVDYHHTFELDMSDYEPVIKIFRIFEIIFFIIGLLLITRQQMIKG